MIPPCLTLSNIRYVLRVKCSSPEKRVSPSPTPWCSSYWKGSLLVALDYGRQLILFIPTLKLAYQKYIHFKSKYMSYIRGSFIKQGEFAPELLIGSTVNSCVFFKINSDGPFHVSRICLTERYGLIFLIAGESVRFHIIGCLFDSDLWVAHMLETFDKTCFSVHMTFFCKFHMVCTSQPL